MSHYAAPKSQVRAAMRSILIDEPDLNATQLAEATANELGCWDYLDNPDHWIWDLALEWTDSDD